MSAEVPQPSIGSVIDTCLSALSSLKTQAERDSVMLALLAVHTPPMGKLAARLPRTTSTFQQPPARAEASAEKKVSSQKKSSVKKKEGKTPPPKPVAWADNVEFKGLKETLKLAAANLVAAKKAAGGRDLPLDHELVVDFNSRRTAVQNFRP